jgi:hypothetical protein
MIRTALALLLLAGANVVTGQNYNFNVATDTCQIQGPNFVCQDTIRIEAEDSSFSDVTLTIGCILDSSFSFDIRRSQGCVCEATIVPSDTTRPSKVCPCSICPAGFGDSPIAIDCTEFDEDPVIDPFIVGQCSSLDCDYTCGTSTTGTDDPPPTPTPPTPTPPTGIVIQKPPTGIVIQNSQQALQYENNQQLGNPENEPPTPETTITITTCRGRKDDGKPCRQNWQCCSRNCRAAERFSSRGVCVTE